MGLLNLLRLFCCCRSGWRWYRYSATYHCDEAEWGTVELAGTLVADEDAFEEGVWTQATWSTNGCTYEMWLRGTPTDEPAEEPDTPSPPVGEPDDCCNDCLECGGHSCYSDKSLGELRRFHVRRIARDKTTHALWWDREWELLAPVTGMTYSSAISASIPFWGAAGAVIRFTDHLANTTALGTYSQCRIVRQCGNLSVRHWDVEFAVESSAEPGFLGVTGIDEVLEPFDSVYGDQHCGAVMESVASAWRDLGDNVEEQITTTVELRVVRNHCCHCDEECGRRYMLRCVEHAVCGDCDGAADDYFVQLPAALGGGGMLVTRDTEQNDWFCAWSGEIDGVSVVLGYDQDDCLWRLFIEGPGGTWEGSMDQQSLPDGVYHHTGGTLADSELAVQEVL